MNRTFTKGVLCTLGAFILHFTLGTVYTFGNMSPYMASYMRLHGSSKWVTNAYMLWIYAFSIGFQGISMVFGGILENRLGARVTTLIGCWTMSISVMLTYFTIEKNIYLVTLTYGAIMGVGTGLSYSVALAEAIKWFPKNRGLIIGIVVAGFGLGSVVFNQVQTAFINPLNLHPNITFGKDKYFDNENMLNRVPYCFLVIGAIYFLLQLIGCTILFKPNSLHEEVFSPDVSINDVIECDQSFERILPPEELQSHSYSIKEVLKKRDFWILWLIFMFNGTLNIYVTSLYKAFGQLFIRNDLYLAIVGSIASLFNAVGRIFWGQIMDRYSYKTAMRILTAVVILFSSTLGLCQYLKSSSGKEAMYMIWVCIIMGNICGIFVLLPSATAKIFGSKNVATIYGMLFSANGIAGIFGAMSTSFLKSTIDYIGIFELGAGLCLISFLLTFCHKNGNL